MLDICTFQLSWKQALYDSHGNALNPCFLALVALAINVVLGILVISQIVDTVFFNSYGPFKIKYSFGKLLPKSIGPAHFFKFASVSLQFVLYVLLADANYSSLIEVKSLSLAATAFITALALILHLIEPTRSIVPHASLLFFWLANSLIALVVWIQDTFAAHKIFIPSSNPGTAHAIEAVLLVNAVLVFYYEYFLYAPSKELVDYFDLNDWNIDTVRDVFCELSLLFLEEAIEKIYVDDEIDLKELPPTHIIYHADQSVANFKKLWDKEVAKADKKRDAKVKKVKNPTAKDQESKPSLYLAVLKSNKREVFLGTVSTLCDTVASYSQPFLLKKFILFFSDIHDADTSAAEKPPVIVGFGLAVGMFALAVIKFISFNRFYIQLFGVNYKMELSLDAMLYEKAVNLSPDAKKSRTTGDIITNLSVDVATVADSLRVTIELLSNPIRLIVCLFSLYKIVGNATWAGLVTACILIPLGSKVSTSISSLYKTAMSYKDERVSLTSEILNSMKSVKLYSWEKPMLAKLDAIRNGKELVNAKRIGIYNACAMFLWECIPFFVSCTCFIAFAVIGGTPLTPSIIFPALALFELLSTPLAVLPNLFSDLVEANVSLKRLREILQAEELSTDHVERSYDPLKINDVSVELKNATIVWSDKGEKDDENNIALKDINFQARKGQLTCIVGKVGSGKTTLIKSILGELSPDPYSDVSIKVNGTFAYCSQSPWVLNATIRENILFGKKYDKAFYQKTIEACQLLPDFAILADGDKTVVGEKGISLSGGQKARVSLARAVYSKADIFLLDDVLSAVDAHVGKSITEQVLGSNGLLATKTIILATNAVSVLHTANEIVLLESGKIVERGKYAEVMANKGHLAALITEFGKKNEEEEQKEEEAAATKSLASASSSQEVAEYRPEPEIQEPIADLERVITHETIGAASAVSFDHDYNLDMDNEDEEGTVRRTGHTEEKGAKGKIALGVYLEYFKACNVYSLFIYVFLYTLNIFLSVFGNYLLKYWSEKNAAAHKTTNPVFFLTLYTMSGVTSSAFSLIAAIIVWSYSVIRSSKYFHDKMANSVLRSPMSFFETTPIGRILNRFSEDITVIDQQIVWCVLGFANFTMNALSLLFIIGYNLPLMFIVLIVLGFLYNHYRVYFIPTSRVLKRIRSARKSPIFSHLQESFNGVETVRAYQQQDRFVYINRSNVDALIKTSFANNLSNRWLSMRLQGISALIVFTSSLMILGTLRSKNPISPGLIGFIMSYVLNITGTLNAIVRFWAEIENRSVNVERLVEYCNLKPEAEMIIDDNRPPVSWPSEGGIEFVNYTTKYRENLDPVLKNINLQIKPSEKIGIVGRTGAGKSTLTLALFRIIEATEGHINIDSYDTSKLGLFDLRRQLNIIPQDAHAFEASIRDNLDPFGQYTDDELWKVLELAHLKEHVENMKTEITDKDTKEVETSTGLNAKITEGGGNLSSGQKQLLCLARALLNKSQVLVLDEATAAVDVQTDKIIQQTIREKFSDKTILTIAHRLETVMDSDRIIVLDKGEVKEFESPEALLKNKDSIFYSLCKEGGYLRKEDISEKK